MRVFNPLLDLSALGDRLNDSSGLLVVCYCADWCDTCRQYQTAFAELAGRWPQHTFIWIDIEDSPELLGDEDVENFPTIALQTREETLFYGTLLPYISHLDRLIDGASTLSAPDTTAPPLLHGLLAP
jgi:thiol-disulfide isomerase/thioredoxin